MRNHPPFGWLIIIFSFFSLAGCSEYRRPAAGSEDEALSSIVQLTKGYDRASGARFSKDMRWIMFQAIPSGEKNAQVYLARLKYLQGMGTAIIGVDLPVRISPPGSKNEAGDFSPDGLSIIFASSSDKPLGPEVNNFRPEMDIYRADNWEQPAGLADPRHGINFALHPLVENDDYDGEASFSPDGKWIAFTSKRDGDLDLYAMHSDGTHVVRLTSSPGYDGGAHFSPDAKHLVYRSDRKGDHLLQIFTSDIKYDDHHEITGLANEKQITIDENINWGPFWYVDGHHILYATNRDGKTNNEIYLMNAKGLLKTRITFSPGVDVLPTISPDGKYLMWSSSRSPDKTMEVFIANFVLPEGS